MSKMVEIASNVKLVDGVAAGQAVDASLLEALLPLADTIIRVL
jgi:hypothetical protein